MRVDAARAKSIRLTASEISSPEKRANDLVKQGGADGPLRGWIEASLRTDADVSCLAAGTSHTFDFVQLIANLEDLRKL